MSDELKFHEQFITLVDEELSLFIFFPSTHSTRDVLLIQLQSNSTTGACVHSTRIVRRSIVCACARLFIAAAVRV